MPAIDPGATVTAGGCGSGVSSSGFRVFVGGTSNPPPPSSTFVVSRHESHDDATHSANIIATIASGAGARTRERGIMTSDDDVNCETANPAAAVSHQDASPAAAAAASLNV